MKKDTKWFLLIILILIIIIILIGAWALYDVIKLAPHA